MDQTTLLVLVVALVGVVAVLVIFNRDRAAAAKSTQESPYAASTEGMQRCPSCGAGNLVTASTCSACGKRLPR